MNKHLKKYYLSCVIGSNIPDCRLEISTIHNVGRAGCKRGFANDRNFSGNIFSSPGKNYLLILYYPKSLALHLRIIFNSEFPIEVQ